MSLVGASVLRNEDPRLLRGAGWYVDDLNLPGMVHACVLRSPLPHARITRFETDAARAREDVVAVFGPDDVAAATASIRCVWVLPGQRQTEYPVVPDVLRFVGDPFGLVVATTRAAAEDAAELVEIDYDPLPSVADPEAAAADGAPHLHPEWGTNVVVEADIGDPPEALEAAIGRAAHVVSRRFRIQRIAGSPIETRGVVARWEPHDGSLTMWTSTQAPHHVREQLAHVLRLPADRIRVVARDVGGGFGNKEHLYQEEVLVALAAVQLGVPVKWIEDRHEAMVATIQAREQVHDARLALDADGRFVALQSRILSNMGARPSNVGAGPALVTSTMLPGPYRFDVAGASFRGVLTNKTPSGAYRGFGMQQAAWVRERLVDEAARELGIDPVELRRRNMLRSEELPYATRTHQLYDSGDYSEALRRVAELIRDGYQPPDDGRRRGIGFCSYVEFTGLGPTKDQEFLNFRLSGYEQAVVRMEPDGTATVLTGTSPQGQGHETTFAQLAADALGLEIGDVRVVYGDTAATPYGSASAIASRSMAVGGGAIVRASAKLREKIMRVGGALLEIDPDDLELADGGVRAKGAPSVNVPFAELAEKAWLGWSLPEGETAGLEERDLHDPAGISYSYATHAAAVAVDVETGHVEVERLAVVHDCGTVVNPMIVTGQVHGGVAQGIGNALLEEVVHDADANPLTTTLMDYLLPTSADVPDVDVVHLETPSPHIPGGMKGMGEGGTIGAAAAVGNAVANALPEIADLVTESPLTPQRIWSWLRSV
jgi:aerobic carbon-monoxide dehydrogenase large subunit